MILSNIFISLMRHEGALGNMFLCIKCLGLGYCARRSCILLSDDDLDNPDFVEDVRACARLLEVSPERWRDYVYDAYRDYPGRVLGPNGTEVFLNLEVFETEGIREWFRDWIYRERPLCRSRKLRVEAKERVRVIGTLLRAQQPIAATTWGLRPANENFAPKTGKF
ncbi:hypothetical protein [Sulfitobacter sp. CS16]|uniref:hypothetical protein n=1 Tax=Sulfitobacter sp. CS16 TaxID=3368573 RepID=UPI003744C14F